jgi:hypothetical protein
MKMKIAASICAFVSLGLAGAWSANLAPHILLGALSIVFLMAALGCLLSDMQFRHACKRINIENKSVIKNDVFVVKSLRYLFGYFYLIDPSKWISGTCKHKHLIARGDYKPYRCIEIYVLGWFAIEVFALVWLISRQVIFTTVEMTFLKIIIPYLCFRLFSIFQSWVNQFILQKEWTAIDVNRSLVLALIGYAEIGIIGAIVRFTYQQICVGQALSDSIMTMIANPQGLSSPIQYAQIMFSILFIVVVMQHIIGRKTSS